MTTGIYVITNKINGKIYIGSSVNINRRWIEHLHKLRKGNHYNDKLQAGFTKYGEENFEFKLLEKVENREDLFVVEQKWLDETGCVTDGYNLADKAFYQPERKVDKETVDKFKESMAEYWASDKFKELMKRNSEFLAKRGVSEETRRKISEAGRGRKPSEKAIAALVSRTKGIPKSEEARKKMSVAKTGYKAPPEVGKKISESNRGKVRTPEMREKYSLAAKKREENKRLQKEKA